jgi:hypothetical protein
MNTTQDPIELMEAWHANECLGMLDRLMLGVPPEGGHVNKETMERMLSTAFLTGAICQQDRPLLPDSATDQEEIIPREWDEPNPRPALSERPTPRTDSEIEGTWWEDGNPCTVPADFARTLERELAEMTELKKHYEEQEESLQMENAHLEKSWRQDEVALYGSFQLLKENGIAPGTKEMIDAYNRFCGTYDEIYRQRNMLADALRNLRNGALKYKMCPDDLEIEDAELALKAVANGERKADAPADGKPDGQEENR